MRMLASTVLCCLVLIAATLARPAHADGNGLPLPVDDQERITKFLGAGVVGQALPSQPIGDPAQYFPLQERALSYQVTSGPHAGNTQTLRVGRRARPNGTPAWRFQLSPTLAAFLR